MTKFFGWYGDFGKVDFSPKQSADAMNKAFISHSSMPLDILSCNSFAGLASVNADIETYSDEFYQIVLTGNFYWGSNTFTEKSSRSGSASLLLELYSKDPNTFLENLKGVFSVVLIDKKLKSVFLAIDRLGIHSLYYSKVKKAIVFSNLCRSVKAHPAISTTISNQAIYDYIYFHMIPSPGTIYKEMNKLPPGHMLSFSENEISISRYWTPKFRDDTGVSIETYKNELKTILHNTISKFTNPSKIGSFLSGGLDSSTVAGVFSNIAKEKKSNCKTKTFTIGFVDADEYDEVPFARVAAKHFDTDAHEYYVSPDDVVNAIPIIANYYDEPFGNSSALPTYFCAKLAKENNISTLLAGDGGDELFAGNARYAKQTVFELYTKLPNFLRQFLLEPLFLKNTIVPKLPIFSKISSYIRQAKVPLPDRLETYNFLHQFNPNDVFSKKFLQKIDVNSPMHSLRGIFQSTDSDSSLNKMLYLDWKITLADNDLRKVVAMCEMADVDVHFPLLDDELVEFSTRLPPNLKLKGQNLRYFFRKAMADFLPAETLAKRKHGFGLPFGLWMHDHKPLQTLAYDTVQNIKERNIFKDEFIDNIIDLHKNQHASYYGEMIWILMMLELWLQHHKT
ncbi:MAG: asparagine synthetase B [Thiohalomonadales bacterium]